MGSCIKAKMFLKKKNRDPLFSLTHCHPPSDLMGDDRCLIYSSCNLFLTTLETPPDTEALIRVHAKATWPWSTCARRQGKKNIFLAAGRILRSRKIIPSSHWCADLIPASG